MGLALSTVVAATGWLLWTWRLRGTTGGGIGGAVTRQPMPRVSIIVPARDEEENLRVLLPSLQALAPAPLEVIVVDDGSRDGTAAVARAAGVEVIDPGPPPPGWCGKPWACWQGARRARGDLLLFTDADTWHAPDTLARAAAALADAGLVSCAPTHRIVRPWEAFQGPFHLLLLVAAGGAHPAAGSRRSYANGQFLMFDRETYERLGGHRVVRDRIAEDIAFAEAVRGVGGRVALVAGRDRLRVRMYPEGLAAFFAGWRRNFRDGLATAGLRGFLETFLVIWWLLGIPLDLVLAVAAAASTAEIGGLAALYLLTAAEIARRQRSAGAFPHVTALAYPVFAIVFVAVSLAAAGDQLRRRPIPWKGRAIERAVTRPAAGASAD